MIHDVAIIGAGPCGLAVASRLRETSPSALFTDIEHARFWNRPHDKNTIENKHKHHNVKEQPYIPSSSPTSDLDIVVFDAHSNKWMSSWKSKFDMLRISHLRSPLFFHPDPRDRDGLLEYAHEQGLARANVEIQGVVGREISKHAMKKAKRRCGKNSSCQSARHLSLDNRDQNDYFTPSSNLFDSYTDSIVKRYHLAEHVRSEKVVDLSYNYISKDSLTKVFTLTTSTGQQCLAHTVVLAAGPVNSPRIPPSLSPLTKHLNHNGSISHIFDATKPLIPTHLANKTSRHEPTSVLIVGGGLTSAQVADLFLSSHNVSKIHLIIRSRVKVKHFDVDLPWVAKLRNREMANFWSADTDGERFNMLRDARNGGSITPLYEKILRKWEKQGRLVIHEGWEIDAGADIDAGVKTAESQTATAWNKERLTWNVILKSSQQAHTPSTSPNTLLEDREQANVQISIPDIDHIIFATSTPPNIHNLPVLHSLHQSHPIQDINGLPVLTQDLAWRSNVPLFVTGALAGLRLGPGAGNLAGARLGAERIAWGIEEVFAGTSESKTDADVDLDVERDDPLHEARKVVKAKQEELIEERRRDSGYASEENWESSKRDGRTGLSVQESDDLWSNYVSGLGNQFAGLALLDEDVECDF